MHSARRVGRAVGLLSLARAPLAPVANFVLLPAVTGAAWLGEAAAHAPRVRAGLLVGLAFALLGLASAIVAAPLLRRYSERMTLALVLLSTLACITTIVENVTLLGMLSLSEQHATAGAAGTISALGHAARATWRWSHFTNLLVGQLASLAFAAVLWRFALVPRLLAGASVAASLAAIVGLAMPLLGRPFSFATLAPLGIAGIALMAWLVARGFEEREPGLLVEKAGDPARGFSAMAS